MTYGELQQEVFDLGFDTDVEPHTLVSATNRVIMQLWRYEPAVERVMLTVREPLLHEPREQTVTSPLRLAREGITAISFESIGRGRVDTDGMGSGVGEEIASTGWRWRRYVLSEKRASYVEFSDLGGFAVRNICLWSVADDMSRADRLPVRRGERICYDLAAHVDGVLGLDDAPTAEDGYPVSDYRLVGAELVLPADLRGGVTVAVRRSPRKATTDHFTTPGYTEQAPDCPERLFDLLALGVAAYVWADLEPEKAAYCKQRFDEGLAMDRLMQDHKGGGTVIRRKKW